MMGLTGISKNMLFDEIVVNISHEAIQKKITGSSSPWPYHVYFIATTLTRIDNRKKAVLDVSVDMKPSRNPTCVHLFPLPLKLLG